MADQKEKEVEDILQRLDELHLALKGEVARRTDGVRVSVGTDGEAVLTVTLTELESSYRAGIASRDPTVTAVMEWSVGGHVVDTQEASAYVTAATPHRARLVAAGEQLGAAAAKFFQKRGRAAAGAVEKLAEWRGQTVSVTKRDGAAVEGVLQRVTMAELTLETPEGASVLPTAGLVQVELKKPGRPAGGIHR